MDWITALTTSQIKSGLPEFRAGDQVRVWCRIMEKDHARQVPFEGIVIRRRGSGISETFTVRRVTYGEGVERIFPVHAPVIERIDVLRRGEVRRSRLYFLRTKVGKTRIASAVAMNQPPAARQPNDSEPRTIPSTQVEASASQPVGSEPRPATGSI